MRLDLDSRDTTEVVADGLHARWASTGHLVDAREDGSLWAVPFDLDRLRVTGSAGRAQEGVVVLGTGWRSADDAGSRLFSGHTPPEALADSPPWSPFAYAGLPGSTDPLRLGTVFRGDSKLDSR